MILLSHILSAVVNKNRIFCKLLIKILTNLDDQPINNGTTFNYLLTIFKKSFEVVVITWKQDSAYLLCKLICAEATCFHKANCCTTKPD